MLKIEKTVFISYRRTNSFHARAIYQDLRNNGYDVFLDYENSDSGAFDPIILNQIKARAHFLVILTPSALERCTDPNNRLRLEIETALEHKRNIIPVMFEGFNWDAMRSHLVGKMTVLDTYSAMEIPASFFESAMDRLRTRFLNIPIDAVIHPTSPANKEALSKKPPVPYSATLDTNSLRAEAYFEKGNDYLAKKDFDHALADFDRVLAIHPNHQLAQEYRDLVLQKKQNLS